MAAAGRGGAYAGWQRQDNALGVQEVLEGALARLLGKASGAGASAAGERLPRAETLRRSADYVRCYRRGRRQSGPFARLHYAPNRLGHPRLGITASRKVGKAVVRNRLKRRVREIYRRWPGRAGLPAVDVVVHLQPAAAGTDFETFREDLVRLLGRLAQRQDGRGDRRGGRR